MEILMLTNAIVPDRLGGAYRYVRELSTALVQRGHEVTIVTKRVDPSHPVEERGEDGVLILRGEVPSKQNPLFAGLLPLAQARFARGALQRFSGSVVHAHFPTSAIPLVRAHRPFVYTFHAPVHREILVERQASYLLPRPVQRPAIAGFRALEAAVVRRAARVVVLSEAMRREVALLDARRASEAALVPGGIDSRHFSPGTPEPDGFADAGSPLLFAARRLVDHLGVVELVEAVALARDALPGMRLAIAGDGALAGKLERRVRALGLSDRVHLLGRIDDDRIVEWYRRADVVVMPSQELEGFGLTTAEALACGTPVIATPVAANLEVAGLLGPRFLAADRSPGAIADALVDVCGDPEFLREAGTRSRAVVVPRFDWSQVASAYEDVYRSIIQG